MSLKSKIEAVIYASEEPVTLVQLVGLFAEEAQAELDELASLQTHLPLEHRTLESAEVRVPDTGVEDRNGDPASVHTGNTSLQIPSIESPVTHSASSHAGDSQPGGSVSTATGNADALAESSLVALSTASDSQEPVQEVLNTPLSTEADAEKRGMRERERLVRDHLRRTVDELMRDYAQSDRGIEVREVAGGFRMGTKPEFHDAVRGFVRLLKPALKLSLQALETLAVVAYKQPVTAAEISEIRGVDSAGVLGGLIARKLIATAGRKQVIGRPMLYKTTREFLVRFGLRDVHELPSMEEFERMAGELNDQEDLPMESTETVIERANARGDADHIREQNSTQDLEAGPGSDLEAEAQPPLSAAVFDTANQAIKNPSPSEATEEANT